MFCNQCGFNNRDGAKFCKKYGADLSLQTATGPRCYPTVGRQAGRAVRQASSRLRKTKDLIIVCSALLVSAEIVVVIFIPKLNSQNNTATSTAR